jgi:hypothetical protein
MDGKGNIVEDRKPARAASIGVKDIYLILTRAELGLD